VTGLVKYYLVEELQDRLIVVITNLKASKVTNTSTRGQLQYLSPTSAPCGGARGKQWGKVVPEFAVVGMIAWLRLFLLLT
jgi:hypothetical protein